MSGSPKTVEDIAVVALGDRIIARIQTILIDVAEEDGYDLILDAADGNILYADPSLDLTQRVLDLLNAGTTP